MTTARPGGKARRALRMRVQAWWDFHVPALARLVLRMRTLAQRVLRVRAPAWWAWHVSALSWRAWHVSALSRRAPRVRTPPWPPPRARSHLSCGSSGREAEGMQPTSFGHHCQSSLKRDLESS